MSPLVGVLVVLVRSMRWTVGLLQAAQQHAFAPVEK